MTTNEEHDGYDDVNNDIAIIGMAGRFPQADNIDQFWTNLVSSTDCITRFSLEELEKMGVSAAALADPNFVPAAGFIADQDKFDAHFFEMNPREAANLDPQHRFALEVAWQTLEHAGYTPESVNGSVGVFAGVNMSTYFIFNLLKGDEATTAGDALDTQISVDKDMFASRISYKLNLNGPSVALGTACSTSLVCIHLACQSLLNGESKMALAGGSHIATPNCTGHVYHQGGYSSPDGYCRPFDAKGQGTVGGAGTCFVLLKRLDDALADNDTIYAVIKGSAVNNDGSEKIGYTAPSIIGQTNIIAEAQAVAGVEADSIRFIEAHGTATELGDPIEFTALTRAFRLQTDQKNFCGIGSVKSNIGHMGVAAGAASIVKAALSLKNKVIPESLNFENPNPKLDIENSPFYVIDKLERIEPGEFPARAGVSSLGIGGTNAHVVLEEPPEVDSSDSRNWQLMLLSAKTPAALDRMTENLATYMKHAAADKLADAAFTLQVGRKPFAFRRAFVVPKDQPGRVAGDIAPAKGFSGKKGEKQKKVVFMFPGGGAQYVNMARGLYQQEPAFKQTLDSCAALFKSKMGLDLIGLIYPDQAKEADVEQHAELLQRPRNFFAALFAVEYSLAKLWMSWGVIPDALIGHSLGEYTAACIAGVFSLEDAVSLICCRGALFEKIEKGSMLSVTLPAAEVDKLLIDGVSIATINDPGRCVVAGRVEPMQAFEQLLEQKQIEYKKLLIDTAGHSPMVDPIMQEFGQFLSTIKFKKPTLPFISNMSGTWADPDQICTAAYWKNHLRQPVRFSDGIATLLKDDNTIFFETGPGNALCSFVRSQQQPDSDSVLLNTLRHVKEEKDDLRHLLETMGKLWLAGAAIDWAAFYAQEKRKRIALPAYPFERKRYWVENRKNQVQSGAKLPVAEWFWQPAWRLEEITPDTPACNAQDAFLVFLDDQQYGAKVVAQLRLTGAQVIIVTHGGSFVESDPECFQIDAGSHADYQQLITRLVALQTVPKTVLHCWSLSHAEGGQQQRDFIQLSFIYLAQALEAHQLVEPLTIAAITNQRQAVLAQDRIDCMQALITGPAKVIPYEFPHIRFVTIDVNLAETAQNDFAPAILSELGQLETTASSANLADGAGNTAVALRSNLRFVKDFVPLETAGQPGAPASLRQQGVYVITGGLGGVGMVHAQMLANYQARLFLLQRTAFPPAEKWSAILTDAAHDLLQKEQIRQILALQAAGAQVQVLQADVTDATQVDSAIAQIRNTAGAIHGLIHCAGYGEFVPIKDTSKHIIEAVMAAKVTGTDHLLAALAGDSLELVILCSSMSAETTGYGLAGYVSACAYLDAVAHAHLRNSSSGGNRATRYVSINWDVWSTPQQTIKAQHDPMLSQRLQENKTAISPREGIEVLYRALSAKTPQAVISTTDFQQLLRKNRKMAGALLAATGDDDNAPDLPQDCLALYDRPSLSTEYVAPDSDEEKLLASIWQETLGIARIGVNDNFFELGGESLLGVKIVVKAKKMGLFFEPKQMFATPTIAQIVQSLDKTAAVIVDQSQVTGAAPCTPVQQQFLDTRWANRDHWNVGIVVNAAQSVSQQQWTTIVTALIEHHDVLRSHFTRGAEGGWQQVYAPAQVGRHAFYIDLSVLGQDAFAASLPTHAQRLQAELKVEEGPVCKLAFFKTPSGPGKIVFIGHHLVMDASSLGIILDDMSTLLAAAGRPGSEMATLLPAKTSSYKDFACRLQQHVNSDALAADIAFWQQVASSAAGAVVLPVDLNDGQNRERDVATVSMNLSPALTQQLLQDACRETGLKINQLLLAALAKTLADWAQGADIRIDMVGHGRPEIDQLDLSRTAGWFGTGMQIPLSLAKTSLPAQLLALKAQIDAVPNQGMSLAWLQRMHASAELRSTLSCITPAAISLNYLGQIDLIAGSALTNAAQDALHGMRDPDNLRQYQHDIVAYSQNGQFTLDWHFSRDRYQAATIQRLLDGMHEHLQQLAHTDWTGSHAAHRRRNLPDPILEQHGIAPDQVEDCHGLTPLQSEIYRLYRNTGSTPHNVTQALSVLEGALDRNLLQAVWQALVARHKVLRTRFIEDVTGRPVQVVCRQADFSLTELDYSHLDEAAQQQALQCLMIDDRHTRYDLSQAPALRLYHVILAPQAARFAVLLSNHQIILDGWTSSLMSQDLLTCLVGMASGNPLPALTGASDFGRYVKWLEKQPNAGSLAYWRDTFKGYRHDLHGEPLQKLIAPAPLLAVGEDTYAEQEIVIEDALLDRIQECARATRTTGNAVFQAAWAISLAQLSGQPDLVYGVTVSGRAADFEGIAEVVGQCTNSLPVRITVAAGDKVSALVQRVHGANANAQAHQHLSLRQIAALINLEDNAPLYSSNFIFENIPRASSGEAAMPIKTVSSKWVDGWHFPLRIFVVPEDQTWVRFAFDRNRFASTDIAQLASRYHRNLAALVERIDAPLSSVLGQ